MVIRNGTFWQYLLRTLHCCCLIKWRWASRSVIPSCLVGPGWHFFEEYDGCDDDANDERTIFWYLESGDENHKWQCFLPNCTCISVNLSSLSHFFRTSPLVSVIMMGDNHNYDDDLQRHSHLTASMMSSGISSIGLSRQIPQFASVSWGNFIFLSGSRLGGIKSIKWKKTTWDHLKKRRIPVAPVTACPALLAHGHSS